MRVFVLEKFVQLPFVRIQKDCLVLNLKVSKKK